MDPQPVSYGDRWVSVSNVRPPVSRYGTDECRQLTFGGLGWGPGLSGCVEEGPRCWLLAGPLGGARGGGGAEGGAGGRCGGTKPKTSIADGSVGGGGGL